MKRNYRKALIIIAMILTTVVILIHFSSIKKQPQDINDYYSGMLENKDTFEVNDIVANAGDEITISVKLLEDLNFVAANFELLYDSSKMEYIKYEKTEILTNAAMSIVNKDKNSDKILIAYVGNPQSETDIVKRGELINITFKLKDTISNVQITPEFKCTTLKEKDGQDVEFSIKQGTISVRDSI